jgi:hypothetical protein
MSAPLHSYTYREHSQRGAREGFLLWHYVPFSLLSGCCDLPYYIFHASMFARQSPQSPYQRLLRPDQNEA